MKPWRDPDAGRASACLWCGLWVGACVCPPRPTVKLPVRTDAPWCPECGMTLPAHWKGCPET